MRTSISLSLLLMLAAAPCRGQVTTNDKALESLRPAAPATPAPAPAQAARHRARRTHAPGTATGKVPGTAPDTAPGTGHAAAKPAPLPVVPAGPPPNPVIVPPPPVLPVHPPPIPPPVPIKADAPGSNGPIPGGMRFIFGPNSSDLNPANDQALLDIARLAALDPTLDIDVTAFAPGTNEDPSTPRRLSLDRALAARAVLINAGVVSERIHAVARGFLGIEGGPPDRMDVVMTRPKSTPAGTPTLPPPPATATPAAATPAAAAGAPAPTRSAPPP
jgi:outer membrane protein OmpA-like peptidoglycan-associated protein